jgi:hypothetical protein
VDAHVPQRKGVVRLSRIRLDRGWPAWLLAIGWVSLLACLPWWIDLPLLLGIAATRAAQLPRLHGYGRALRVALRWGLVGSLLAGYRALGAHVPAIIVTLLAALIGFSLLMLLESWLDHPPLRSAAIAAASPAWSEMALAPVGPAGVMIELQAPAWHECGDPAEGVATDVRWLDQRSCLVDERIRIDHVEPQVSVAPGQGWLAWPITAWRGVVLYDRAGQRTYRLRGWQLYGWHAGEAWLSRGEDQPPLALSHVLGQDQLEE